MLSVFTATPATDEAFGLAEGPIWDDAKGRLLWVDIPNGLVLEGVLEGDRLRIVERNEFGENVGAVALRQGGGYLVAAQECLIEVAVDGTRTPGPRVIASGEPRRMNDGSTDPAGRFLVGTLSFGTSSNEELVRLRRDGSLEVIDDDLTLSNGLAWSVDGSVMYSVDSLTQRVWKRAYDVATGEVGPRAVHLTIEDGKPDGICIDAMDHLWVAIWGGGQVRRFAPDGSQVARVEVAAPHTSSMAFAGPDLDQLVITSATVELTDEQLATYPMSGHLFSARVGVTGLPSVRWNPQA